MDPIFLAVGLFTLAGVGVLIKSGFFRDEENATQPRQGQQPYTPPAPGQAAYPADPPGFPNQTPPPFPPGQVFAGSVPQQPMPYPYAPPQMAAPAPIPQNLARKLDYVNVCRNCLSENPPGAEFCSRCGRYLAASKVQGILEDHKKWFNALGWTSNPFTLDVIPSLFTGYKTEISTILEKLSLKSGNILVLGDSGVGKTTLLRWLTLNLPPRFFPLYIHRMPKEYAQIFDLIRFSLTQDRTSSPSGTGLSQVEAVINQNLKDRILVVMIDEAHDLDEDACKNLLSLGDIQNVIIILAGMPQLKDVIMNDAPLFYNRFTEKIVLDHLSLDDTKNLIIKRIANVGGRGFEPFTDGALQKIYEHSKGHPRTIIKICDRLVSKALNSNASVIDEDMVDSVCNAMSLDDERELGRIIKKEQERIVSGKKAKVKKRKYEGGEAAAEVEKPASQVEEKKTVEPPAEEPPSTLKAQVLERLEKMTAAYKGYKSDGDDVGVLQLKEMASTTIEDIKRMAEDPGISAQKRRELEGIVGLFQDWIRDHQH